VKRPPLDRTESPARTSGGVHSVRQSRDCVLPIQSSQTMVVCGVCCCAFLLSDRVVSS